MSSTSGQYTLATGVAAARRLHLLHNAYGPVGRRVLEEAGVGPGIRVADFGCGVGATSGELAGLVGPGGHVTGIDHSAGLLSQGELERTLADMERDARNPDVLVICPRMSLVWARKPQ